MSANLASAVRVSILIAAAMTLPAAHALPPDQVFERAAPGVWALRALDADEKPLVLASAVVVGPGKLVTSCQVLARARKIELRRANAIYEAKLEFPDVERDLCQLSAEGLSAPVGPLASARGLRPGQRVYVVGYTRGAEQSIADGLVSTVRDGGTNNERVQTSVPAARGLLGAGLYDDEARLVGIVTASAKDAPNAAFAVPADWIAEVASRGAAALAKRTAAIASAVPGTAAAPGMPTPGTTWRYGYVDRKYSRTNQEFTVRATQVSGATVQDLLEAPGKPAQAAAIEARQPRFLVRSLAAGQSLLELAPYLLAATGPAMRSGIEKPMGYPNNYSLVDWVISVSPPDWESITVPAGTFKALRVTVTGMRNIGEVSRRMIEPSRFEYIIWFVPEIGRYAMIKHQAQTEASPVSDETIELLEYKRG